VDTAGSRRGWRAARRGIQPAVAATIIVLGMLGAGCHSQTVGAGSFGDTGGTGGTGGTGATTGTQAPTGATGGPAASTSRPATGTPSGAPLSPIPQPFAGRWAGQVFRPNTQNPVRSLIIVLPLGKTTGTFTIGGYCSGIISVLSTTSTRLLALEAVSVDPNKRCGSGGFLSLDLTAGNRVQVSWNDPSQADQVAPGVLTRG
jgi:hypothetical protein